MGDFGENYDSTEIYNDSKASEPEKSLNDPNLTNNDSACTNTVIEIMMKASKITDFDFDKICESCMRSKETWVVRQYKLTTPTKEKLEEVYINLWGPHNPPSLSRNVYTAILVCEKTRKS